MKHTHLYGINMLDISFNMRGDFLLSDNKVNVKQLSQERGSTCVSHQLTVKGTIARRKRSGPDTLEMLLFFLPLQSTIEFCHVSVNIKE